MNRKVFLNRYIIILFYFLFSAPEILPQDNDYKLLNIADEQMLFNEEKIINQMRKTLDWQLDNLPEKSWLASKNAFEKIRSNGWIRSAFYTGVVAVYKITKDEKYLNNLFKWGEDNNWRPAERPRHADDQCCIQSYADLYLMNSSKADLNPSIKLFDEIAENPMLPSKVGWRKEINWMWCDALFMAPPAMTKISYVTGNKKYLELMDVMYNETYEYLYDKKEKLFYRDDRFKPDSDPVLLSENGKPIFWSRGNGWVLAGLARMLEFMPDDFGRKHWYENLFEEMSGKLKTLQSENGFWHSNLLDPEASPEPESSGTAFFCFGLAWGVNNGYLQKDEYLPVIKKAWTALNRCLDQNGQLHWVQLVGSAPAPVKYEDSVEYATGAFLLAGSEVVKLFIK